MILAVAVLAQRLATGALEVQAGGVHEHQVEPGEQIAPMREQPLLHHVLQAAWRERRAPVLLLSPAVPRPATPSPDRDDADRALRRRRWCNPRANDRRRGRNRSRTADAAR